MTTTVRDSLAELLDWMRSNKGPSDGVHDMLVRAAAALDADAKLLYPIDGLYTVQQVRAAPGFAAGYWQWCARIGPDSVYGGFETEDAARRDARETLAMRLGAA